MGELYPGDIRHMVAFAYNEIRCYRNGPAANGIYHRDRFDWLTDGTHVTFTFSRMGKDGRYHIEYRTRN